MVACYTFGTRFVPIVILAAFLYCCTVQSVAAQGFALAFSTTNSVGIDGFNNGVFQLPTSSLVPVSIGLFDTQTGVLSPALSDVHLAIDILDAAGVPHPQLSLYGSSTVILQAGASTVSMNTGLRWQGSAPTSATVRVRDLDNVLANIMIPVLFDPSLIGDVHVVARIVDDRNLNGVYDDTDILQKDARLSVCQLGGMLLMAQPDGAYRLDLPGYGGTFPLRLVPVGRPQWQSATTGGMAGIVIEGYGTYSPTYLVQQVPTPWIWSGVVHRPSADLVCVRRDSSILFAPFTNASILSMELQTSDWRMTSIITPSAATTGVLSLKFYQGLCQEEKQAGELSILCSNDRELVTPLFSTPYDLIVYRNGAVVYTHNGRVGPAVSLVRTVRRWFARQGTLGVEELQGAKVQVVGGPLLKADSVVFRPQMDNLPTNIARIVCTGKGIDTLEIFDHEIRAFGLYHRAAGTLLPVQTTPQELAVVAPEYQGEMRIALPQSKTRGFTVEWGEPVAPDNAPQVELSARGGRDALTRNLGSIAFRKNAAKTFIHALPPQSEGEEAVQVQVLLDGTYITDGIAKGDTAAFSAVWPYRAGVTVRNGVVYVVQWREPVIVQLADGRAVECDELRLVYPTTVPSVWVLSDINLRMIHGEYIPVHDESSDTVIPALPLTAKITLTGNVYEDKDVSSTLSTGEPGRSGRIVAFKGDPTIGWQIAYDTTDGSGFFTIDFDPIVQGWAPEKVSIASVAGWVRTSADFDLVSLNQCNQSLSGLNFGEIPADYSYPNSKEMYSGVYDDFLQAAAEVSSPSGQLEMLVADHGYEPIAAYDTEFHNRFFLHTFEGIRPDSCALTGAQLKMRLRACTEDAYNDRIVLQSSGQQFWHSDISQQAANGVWYKGKTSDIVLDMHALPLGNAGVYDAVQLLQAGQLDLMIDDDTQIDYALLTIELACVAEDPDIIPTGVASDHSAGASDVQVFPNPSTGAGTVVFTLPHSDTVTLVLYDQLSREVVRLLNGVLLPAGRHAVSFALPSLARGRYTLAVRTGYSTRTQGLWIEP